MANTLHDNIVVKSKLETVTKIEGQPALEKKVCDLATQVVARQEDDKHVAGRGTTKSTALKNTILDAYQLKHGPKNGKPIITTKTGEPTQSSTIIPSISNLVTAPIMRPNIRRVYRVKDLDIYNVLVIALRHQGILKRVYDYAIEEEDYRSMCLVSKRFAKVTIETKRLLSVDFTPLRHPRIGYANQTEVSLERVDMMAAAMIHYGLNPGMLVRYLGGEYTGAYRDIKMLKEKLMPHVPVDDMSQIMRILTSGCPADFALEESAASKALMIKRGNQKNFVMNEEKVRKTVNKEDRFSHLIPLPPWILDCSPYCRHNSQGIIIKAGKNDRVVWDASTKFAYDDLVLNEHTPTDDEAPITFGITKMQFYIWVYNMRISFPDTVILAAMADVKACFRFPRIHPDLTGAFGFLADAFYCLATAMVFGSVTSASSWEPFRRAIETMTTVYFPQKDLVQKHKKYLDMLIWDSSCSKEKDFVTAKPCPLNPGILDEQGKMKPLRALMYVDDALMAAPGRKHMEQLLAAAIEAIFTVMGLPDTEVRQCSLAMDKWVGHVVGESQIMLGIDMNFSQLDVGVSDQYRKECIDLIDISWPKSRVMFTAKCASKLLGKLARLSEGANWVFHLMSHIYASVGFALQENRKFLAQSSHRFQNLAHKIQMRDFKHSDNPAKELHFALKEAARMVHKAPLRYRINKTMKDELDFIRQALAFGSDIPWRTKLGLIIPRIPLWQQFGDASLLAGGGFSIDLRFIWQLYFPDKVVQRTLLHNRDGRNGQLISINVLEFVVVVISYAAAYTAVTTEQVTDDPCPIVLNVTDNMSALNWTMHACKKSAIGRRLARFFCGLLIGSPLGINSKWISTKQNTIADEISRLKRNSCPDTSNNLPTFAYTSLKQKFKELKVCRSFQPSQELLSMIWDILLTEKLPCPRAIMQLRQNGLGKLIS